MNRIVLAHLNINSLRNKLDLLADQIKRNVDNLAISETKLDDAFPVRQFKIPGYASPLRLDQNQNGGEILVFAREDIPVKLFSEERSLDLYSAHYENTILIGYFNVTIDDARMEAFSEKIQPVLKIQKILLVLI